MEQSNGHMWSKNVITKYLVSLRVSPLVATMKGRLMQLYCASVLPQRCLQWHTTMPLFFIRPVRNTVEVEVH